MSKVCKGCGKSTGAGCLKISCPMLAPAVITFSDYTSPSGIQAMVDGKLTPVTPAVITALALNAMRLANV